MGHSLLGYVLSWTSQKMYVVCPFCELLHSHGYPREGFSTRRSDCSPGGSYRVVFPFETGSEAFHLHFEIEKRRKTYNTVGINMRDEWEIDEDSREVGSLADQFQNLEFEDNVVDEVLREEAQWLISFSVSNDVLELKRFFKSAKSSLQQLVSYTDETGNTALTNTAMEGHEDILDLLVTHGSDINHQNHEGRTALMEAVIYGRLYSVQFLLSKHADRSLTDIYGNDALKLSRNSNNGYGVLKIALNKVIITTLLKVPPRGALIRPTTHAPTSSGPHYGAFHGDGLQRTYVDAVETLDLKSGSQAVARLERGGPFPVIRAASGWTTYATSPAPIDAAHWTKEVFRISKLVGHNLTREPFRHSGTVGQWNACHVEKQLVVWFLDKHVILPDEIGDECEEGNRLDELLTVQPRERLKGARIFVSKKVCDCCCQFINKVNKAFGLTLVAVDRSVREVTV